MAALDFNAMLDTKVESIEKPALPPVGHYVWSVPKVPSIVDKDDWQIVEFQLRAVSVFEDAGDVDADDLKAYGKVTNITNRKSFIFDKNDKAAFDRTLWNLRTFLKDHLQVEMDENTPLRLALNDAVNKRCVGQLTHAPDKQNPENMFANVGRTAPFV